MRHLSTTHQKLILTTIVVGCVLILIHLRLSPSSIPATASSMGVTHIVLFQFKTSAGPEAVNEVGFLSHIRKVEVDLVRKDLAAACLP